VPAVSKLVPKSVPSLAFAGIVAAVSYGVGHIALVSGFVDRQIKNTLESTTIPLWKSKQNVASL
jgi:hypothetical protein